MQKQYKNTMKLKENAPYKCKVLILYWFYKVLLPMYFTTIWKTPIDLKTLDVRNVKTIQNYNEI